MRSALVSSLGAAIRGAAAPSRMTLPWTATVAAGKAACVLTAAYLLWKVASGVVEWIRAYQILARQNVPKPPLSGMLKDLSRADIHRIGPPHEKDLGGIFWAHLLHYHMMIVTEPTMVTQALDRQLYPEYIDKPSLYDVINQGTADPPCPSLVTSRTGDPYWKLVRKGVSHAFAPNNVRSASETSIAVATRLADTLAAHGAAEALDMDAVLQTAAFDVIGIFGFSKDFRATLDLHGEGAQACKCLSEGMLIAIQRQLQPTHSIPFTKASQHFWSTRNNLLGIFRSLMSEALSRGEPAADDQSISAFLQRIRAPDGSPLPRLRFWSESSIMFFAGVETTGHTLGFILLYISQHPEVEAKIVQELREIGVCPSREGVPPRALTLADLPKLSYLQCVIKETQRLMPVIPLVLRYAVKDVKIGNTLVPRNTLLLPHFLAMHTSHRYWERPLDFIPERWLDPDCKYTRPIDPSSSYVPTGPADIFADDKKPACNGASAKLDINVNGTQSSTPATNGHDPFMYKGQRVRRYQPFASGSRNCVGMPQAHVTMQATLATLLSRFSFRLADQMGTLEDVHKAEMYHITFSIKGGLWMHCEPRSAT